MSERRLRLLKFDNTPDAEVDPPDLSVADGEIGNIQDVDPGDTLADSHAVDTDNTLPMTPAEAEEAARFRRMAADKAARQLMLEQIMAELAELAEPDDLSSAA